MIVKVQQSVTTTEENTQILVYNKDKSISYQDDITKELKEILGNRLKVYFKAKLDNENRIVLIKEIKNQNW